MPDLNEQLRAEFEAWYLQHNPGFENWMIEYQPRINAYRQSEVDHAWDVWQAARRQHGSAAQPIPMEAIGKILAEVMDVAVANGANSVSMPDEYVAVAHFLSYPHEYGAAPPVGCANNTQPVADAELPVQPPLAVREIIRNINSDSGEGWSSSDEDAYWREICSALSRRPAATTEGEFDVVAKLPDIHAKLREAYSEGACYEGGNGIDAQAYIVAEKIMREWDLPDYPLVPAEVAAEQPAAEQAKAAHVEWRKKDGRPAAAGNALTDEQSHAEFMRHFPMPEGLRASVYDAWQHDQLRRKEGWEAAIKHLRAAPQAAQAVASNCRATCDVCFDEVGNEWPCVKDKARARIAAHTTKERSERETRASDGEDAARFVFEHSDHEAMLQIEMEAIRTETPRPIEWWRKKIDAAMQQAASK